MKERADKILADRGLVASRSQAKSLIQEGLVLCNGVILKKAGELVPPDASLEVQSPLYVGRGAFKLEKALEVFSIEVSDKVFMDVGASTGGFTEVLLDRGARRVYAIDVGTGQLAEKLRTNPRVVNLEKTNIKDLMTLPEPISGAVMDLSFISITKVIPSLQVLLEPGAFLIALVKPQFEAGPELLPKDGVIKDSALQETILERVIAAFISQGWKLAGSIPSPIEGKAGNREFLVWLISPRG